MLVVSLMIGLGVVLIIWGLSTAVTGDEANDYPENVESVSPIPNAEQVPRQTQVVVDLAAGYEGTLTIDDIDIEVVRLNSIEVEPGQQVRLPAAAIYDPGNATIRFTPSDDAVIDSFSPGRHTARVVFWKSSEGREMARSFTWVFDVL